MLKSVLPPSKPNIGTISNGVKEITFIYQTNKEEPTLAKVIVHYEDKDGNTLVKDVVIDGYAGDLYTSTKEIINGYQYVETIGNANGKMTEGIYEVTYVYELIPEETIEEAKDAYIIISYVDEDNNPILDEVLQKGKDNETYIVTKKAISGYTYQGVEGEEIGVYTSEEIQRIIYSYKKIEEENNTSDDNNCNNCCNNCCNNGCNGESGSSNNNPSININIGDTTINNDNKQGDINISTGDNNNTNTSDSSSQGGNSSSNSNAETGDSTSTSEGGNSSSEGGNSSSESTNTNDNQSAGGNSTAEGGNSTSQGGEGGNSSSENNTEIGDNTNNNNSEGGNSTSQAEGGNSSSESSSQGGNSTTEEGASTSQGGNSSSKSQSSNGDNTNDNVINIGDNTNTSSSEGGNNTLGDSTSSSEGGNSSTGDNNNTNNNNSNDNTCKENCENTCKDNCSPEEPKRIETGLVVTYYRDELGNIIADSETLEKEVNTNYATKEKSIKDYEIVNVVGNTIGKVTEDPIVVTYYYKKNETEEEPIQCENNCKPVVVVTPTTCDNNCSPTIIVNPTTCEGTTCNDKKQGIVIAHYVDEDNTPISSDVITIDEVDKYYATNKKEISNYQFVKVNGQEIGKCIDGTIEVTYVYKKNVTPVVPEKKYGTVNVHYVDTEGNKISGDVTTIKEVGETYETEKRNITGYKYVTELGKVSGNYKEGVQEVVYIYEKEQTQPVPEIEKGTIIIHYVDTDGNYLTNDIIETNTVGESYTSEQKSFDNYEFVTIIGNRSGLFQKGTYEVTYIFKKKVSCPEKECEKPPVCPTPECEQKEGTVKVRFIDTEGNVISQEIKTKDEVGQKYQTVPKTIPGYTYKTVFGDESGKYAEGEIEVIYIYEKIKEPVKTGKVITHYIDETGTKLLEDKISEGKASNPYKTIKEDIDKYELIEVKGKETGEYSEKDTEVTYVYGKKKGKVIAHYVDIYGNMIGYDIIQEGYLDDKYETKLRKFRGYDFVQIVGDLAGQYRTSDIHVTYIYQKREEQVQPIGSPIIIPDEAAMLSTKRSASSPSLSIYDPIEIPNTGIDYDKDYFTFFILMICNISIVLYLRKKVCFD